jgi:DUF1365 family protein
MNALYRTLVTHTRLRPLHHHLRYRVAYLLLDLENLPQLRFFSSVRFNLFSFRAGDYGDGSGDLRGFVRAKLAAAGMADAGWRISLLTTPRFLGHAFNPLSLYFCRDEQDRLRAVLYEVNNTFGQRHGYLFAVTESGGRALRHECGKDFHVSPFLDMDLRYRFALCPPGEALGLRIAVEDAQGVVLLRAAMAGRREALTDAALRRAAWEMPFQGFKILAGIHWEALKLWLKGMRPRPRPAAPETAVTIIPAETEWAG